MGRPTEMEKLKALLKAIIVSGGCQSGERRKCVDLFLKKMFDFLMPITYKYLFKAAHEESGIFNREKYNQKFKKPTHKYSQIGRKR